MLFLRRPLQSLSLFSLRPVQSLLSIPVQNTARMVRSRSRSPFRGPPRPPHAHYRRREISPPRTNGEPSSSVSQRRNRRSETLVADRQPRTAADLDLHLLLERVDTQKQAAARQVRKSSGPQSRTPWSKHDEAILVDAVYTYQAKWSTITKECSFEVYRDALAVRDKARNIKKQILL